MTQFSIRYWGVRGSVPVPGDSTARYGGNTSCVEVLTSAGRIIVDGGTGLRLLGGTIGKPEDIYMVFTHLHWDHIQGFPFFAPIYRNGFSINVFSDHKADVSLESVLRGQMQEPNFPVDLSKLPAALHFNEVHTGDRFDVPGAHLSTVALNHPNGAMGVRFDWQGRSFVHLTDHEHVPEFDDSITSFCEGADLLSMDTMFTPDEYPGFIGWGHSSWRHATKIARAADVKKLVLFHHDPSHDDDRMDAIGADAAKEFSNLLVAKEGLILDL